MNKLRLKFLNNKLEYAKMCPNFIGNLGYKYLYEYDNVQLKSFIEYEIDGKILTEILWGEKNRGLLEIVIGLLGSVNKAYDELMIKFFLRETINKEIIHEVYARNRIVIDQKKIELLESNFQKEHITIYACNCCLDCITVRMRIMRNGGSYYWETDRGKIYLFEKEEYEQEFNRYRNKIRSSKFEFNEFTELYKFE